MFSYLFFVSCSCSFWVIIFVFILLFSSTVIYPFVLLCFLMVFQFCRGLQLLWHHNKFNLLFVCIIYVFFCVLDLSWQLSFLFLLGALSGVLFVLLFFIMFLLFLLGNYFDTFYADLFNILLFYSLFLLFFYFLCFHHL